MSKFIQDSFSSGLVFYGSDVDIPEDGYQWLLNGRTREGNIKPIEKHLEIVAPLTGLKQGIATLGNLLIMFIEGRAFYRRFGTTAWISLGTFSMSKTAERFYTQVVPRSTADFKRTLASNGNIYEDIQSLNSSIVAGTPSGLIVQDGINQPQFIYVKETSSGDSAVITRTLHGFDLWRNYSTTGNSREYVPIGKQMMWFNGKLFIVSSDGSKIYHSVSGRPLDFMINVDTNGNKGSDENKFGANSTSFTFDYEPITAIVPSSSPDSFIYTTANSVRIVTLDYNKTIFGEPTYRESAKITDGNINDKSIVEVLGDYIFIDRESVTAFNPVKQLKIEGKNSVFSKMLTTVLKNIKQTNKVSIGEHDDYRLISIQSTFGPILAIFDIIQNLWVSFDITKAVRVKEFAILSTDTSKQIFCITWENTCFELFADTTSVESCTLRTRAFVVPDNIKEHKTQHLRLSFAGGGLSDTCRVIEYVDEQLSQQKTLPIRYREEGIKYPVRGPVIMPNDVMYSYTKFEMPNGLAGRKIWFIIAWVGKAILEEIQLVTTDINKEVSQKQSAAEAAK